MPQHGNRLATRGKWPPSGLWQWSCVYFVTAWSVCRFWHHRPRHPDQKVTYHFWLFWNGSELVHLLSKFSHSVCFCWSRINSTRFEMCCATGFSSGTSLIYFVHTAKQTALSSPFPPKRNRSNYGWRMRSCPRQTPHLPWCEAGHTTYLEATDREDGEKRSAETSPDEKARRNFLGCRLINFDQNLHSNSTTNHGVCIHYMGNGCQDQQEQAGQSPEHGSASHTWSHENHSSAWHGKNSQRGATWEEKKSQNPHSGIKTKKAAFPPSTHKPGTTHQKSPQTPKPEPPVQRTVQDTPGHCGCANRAADRACLAARQRDRHTNFSECPRHHLKGTAPWRAQKPHTCPDRWQIPSHCLDSCLHWWICWGGDEKWW